jgi:hydrogenase small subunit
MEGWDGNALRIADEKGTDIVLKCAKNADAIICCGSCAVDGGWQAAYPNPAGATGVEPFLKESQAKGTFTGKIPQIINVPTCPSNPEHLVAILIDYLLIRKLPKLNEYNMPELMFGQTIHDNCPRRGHFENGEFVYEFGSDEEKKNYCLYAMGCKGPQTHNNCPIVLWNRRTNWCVDAGAPCIGCANANPNYRGFNWVDLDAPFLKRFKDLNIGGFTFDPTYLAYIVGGIVVVALVAHGFGMKATGRTSGGAPFEKERKWDTKHPDNPITIQPTAAQLAAAKAPAQEEGSDDTQGGEE